MHRTPDDILGIVLEMRPNSLKEDTLLFMLSDLEERVNIEVFKAPREENLADKLQVETPYEDIYWKELVAIVDFAQGNMENYKYSRELADKAWERLRKYHFRSNGKMAFEPEIE